VTPPLAPQAKRGFGPALDLAVLDQIELTRPVERENRRERIVLIDGVHEPRRSPQHFGSHERPAGPSMSLPVMMWNARQR